MLYDKSLEKDNCGFGLIAHIEGEPSHKVVRTAIHALARMQHRGAILADGKTGDGCGLLLQKPDRFFRIVAEERGWRLAKNYAVGMLFLNQDPEKAAASRRIVEEELQRETLSIVGWRDVPTNEGVLGEIALSSLPRIEQIFVNAPAGWRPRDMERRLFIARRRIEKRLQDDKEFYVCSLSNLVNIYKGLCMPADLPRFYLDLADLRLESAICLFHQRFSTNTVPRWPLAQPFRYLAHNGEINTITGNRQWARARTYKFQTPLIPDLHDAAPFVNETGSDSSSMDNMLELLLAGGMPLFDACIHSFGSAGTGGFSSRNLSVGAYNNPYFEIVIGIFMLLFGINFNLYYFLLVRRFRDVFRSEELWAYVLIVATAVAAITLDIVHMYESVGTSLRHAFFQVSSIITTTGYATVDFNTWPTFSKAILVALMFIGGCAGSTAGGIKVARVVILQKVSVSEMRRMLHPNAVPAIQFEGKPLNERSIRGVHLFLAVYLMVFVASCLLVSLEQLDLVTTFTAVAACINNVGPGLEIVGPMGNFSSFSPWSKLLLSFDMLVGRLEIFPMLLLFAPSIWKRRLPSRRLVD